MSDVKFDVALSWDGITLQPGGYEVSVLPEECVVVLRQRDTEVARLAATLRSSKMRVKQLHAQLFHVQGEPRRLLVVRTPPADEWVVSLDEV
jgi:hypothetical protein